LTQKLTSVNTYQILNLTLLYYPMVLLNLRRE